MKLKILFICTGNSCRSQMAEGWMKHLYPELLEAYSAGTDAGALNNKAVLVMKESGVDISSQKSKNIEELASLEFDYVVTVCDNAYKNCPNYPAKLKLIHACFDDPPKVARAKDENESLASYRRVRDEIKLFVIRLAESIKKKAIPPTSVDI